MKKLRYLCETAAVRFAVWLFPRLPRHALLALARIIGTLAWALDTRGRQTANENLRVAFKGALPAKRVRQIARGSYQNFARTFFDLFWGSNLTNENVRQLVQVPADSERLVADALRTGAIWVTPHFGNFEYAAMIWGFFDVRFTIVAQDFKNPALTDIFAKLRGLSGHQIIPQEAAMLKLAKALKRHGNAALLPDLTIKPGRSAAPIRCFGLLTSVTTLHVQLAQRFGLAIYSAYCLPRPDGTYLFDFPLILHPSAQDSSARLTQVVWDSLEPIIRQHPECWMWMYKHWRYLPGDDTDGEYPVYANPNKAFARMVADARTTASLG